MFMFLYLVKGSLPFIIGTYDYQNIGVTGYLKHISYCDDTTHRGLTSININQCGDHKQKQIYIEIKTRFTG